MALWCIKFGDSQDEQPDSRPSRGSIAGKP